MKLWTGLKNLWNKVAAPQAVHMTVDGKAVPERLTLAFSRAVDYESLDRFFAPDLKEKMDPDGYVKKRHETVFRKAVNEGSAAFLKDDKGNAYTLTVAYRLHETAGSAQHDYTELGTSLARMQGYKSAQLVIAALALKEWWAAMPQKDIVADIKYENVPSVKVYHNALGWEAEPDSSALDGFFAASYATIADKNGQPLPPPDRAERDSISMHACKVQGMAMQAQILLEYMKQGELFNKRTEHTIDVDISVLDGVGLTRKRLEAIAAGKTSRTQLLQLG